jgi:hypothetical protein
MGLEKPFELIDTVQNDIEGKDETGEGRGGFIARNA